MKTGGFQTFFFWWKWLLAETRIVPFSFLAEKGYGGNGQYYFGGNG
jgi:hypothetical protein